MDQALIQVGLPVKCCWADCKTTGFVKPWTDYGGWVRRWRRKWYCPSHAKEAKERYDSFVDQYRTPEPAPEPPKDTVDELYKLLDEESE